MICETKKETLNKIMKDGTSHPGKFITFDGNVVVACDNSDGVPFSETFADGFMALEWLAGDDPIPDVHIFKHVTAAYKDQTNLILVANIGNIEVGSLEYSVFEEQPHISMIKVQPCFRRHGIATQMLQYLQQENKDVEIIWGYCTKDGSALYNSVVREFPNPAFSNTAKALKKLEAKYNEYLSRLSAGETLSEEEGDDLDRLERQKDDLEAKLRETPPRLSRIKLPQDKFLSQIDWPLLYQQKMAVFELMDFLQNQHWDDTAYPKAQNAFNWLDGLIGALDVMTDTAANAGVFQYPEWDEDGQPVDPKYRNVLDRDPAQS